MANKTYNGLPLINLDIVDEMNGVEIISLVDFPAVERNFIKFSKEEDVKLSINEEKKIVTGVALIPDQPIYRKNEAGQGYYITFSKDAIERICQKFFADGNSANVNLEHQVMVGDCAYFESYLINNDRGICPVEFSDLPNGTWIVSCKINNDAVWELIKNGTLRGFSIEGNLNSVEYEEETIDSIEDLLKKIKEL